ncbi:MAG TPA: BNR repeat-containing protein [Armatimonadota bacterium]|nr:BNR repeat-containing protein [Armatimonadota bacterium]
MRQLALNRVLWLLAGIILFAVSQGNAAPGKEQVIKQIDIAPAWAGHPVGFALLTSGKRQFVAFYDAERRMTVASRTLDSEEWHLVRLPTSVGWDSHNYIALAADDEGYLHIVGNIHASPLIYFRTTRPYDIDSFEKVDHMIGDREAHTTYPSFLRGPRNEFIFTYRDGSSGNGDQIWNMYDQQKHAWRRLLDVPLFGGNGQMNAYFSGPSRGPDGYFHICWVWRNTPDCASNHDLSYARSKDLVHWETSTGKPLALPITLATGDVVDPVPPGGGIINGNTRIGFDSRKRLILSYHKHDAAGNTQIYNARLEDGHWHIYQTSDWKYHWQFQGGGSIHFEISLGPVRCDADGRLTQRYGHDKFGSGTWILDEKTLKPIGQATAAPDLLKDYHKPVSTFPNMQVMWANDSGEPAADGTRYQLRWETLPVNRDRQPEGPIPAPTMLRLFVIKPQS